MGQTVGVQMQHVLGRAEMRQNPCGTGEVSVFETVSIEDADSFGADQNLRSIDNNASTFKLVAHSNGVLLARQQGNEFVHAPATELINVDLDLHDDLRTPDLPLLGAPNYGPAEHASHRRRSNEACSPLPDTSSGGQLPRSQPERADAFKNIAVIVHPPGTRNAPAQRAEAQPVLPR